MATIAQTTQGVSTYDLETGTTTYDLTQMSAGLRWQCAVSQATEAARRRFPHSLDRIERAYSLVHAASVVLHPATKSATVTSSDGTRTYHVNGTCACPDAPRAPEAYCKHRLAAAILRKAVGLVEEWKAATAPVTMTPQALETTEEVAEPVTEEPVPTAAPVLEAEVEGSTPRIPREFLYDRHGTTAILWGGLLHMAHEAGMHSMTVDVVTVTPEVAVMRATARFNDGGEWSDIGDAAPGNVGTRIAPHFIRMASTRAMARVLRLALDVPYVCSCELSDD